MASTHKLDFVDSEISSLKRDNLYRKLNNISVSGARITIRNRTLLNLCSNDYLGIPTSHMRIKQFQSSSRLVSGNDQSFRVLEKALSKHKSKQDSLTFPTGYMANLGAISAVARKGDLILSDELNHASIIESCRLSGARVEVFRHNDMEDLQKKARKKTKNKFIVTEGIFSMDGDFSELRKITEISEKHGIITIVDDAHGDFVVGRDGKGTPNHFRVSKKVDIYISSLSKGLGSFGGYVSAQGNVIDLCINRSRSFIYTSALPSFLVDYSLKRICSDREKYRKRLERNRKMLVKGLRQVGFDIRSDTHIVPIIVGDERSAMELGRFLLKNGIFAQPIRYPTVPKNQARLRISVSALLSKEDIQKSLHVFEHAYRKFFSTSA